MAGKMTNFVAALLLFLPFWVSSVSAFPLMSLHSRDDAGGDSPLGGSDNKTDIGYCGDMNTATFLTEGYPETGSGFYVTNQDTSGENFFLIENSRDTHPWKSPPAPVASSKSVTLGRAASCAEPPQSNTDGNVHNLGTWIESSVVNGVMSGDISFLQGCDGGAKLVSNDGRSITKSCMVDMLSGAPSDALEKKGTGTSALKRITGDGFSQAAKDWDLSKCDASQVFLLEDNRNPIIDSTNGRFEVTFYKGKA
ncbi:hypothetical protein PG996_006254 [Apiospora saccharicola]|uniref:Uncharacterized protein n=1 Tax=Apiospora saccharicola TaxID=335842 RepID=A0ABR1VRI4_9PEZI